MKTKTNTKTYNIMGEYQGEIEVIEDNVVSSEYANVLLETYRVAFGRGWRIWKELA